MWYQSCSNDCLHESLLTIFRTITADRCIERAQTHDHDLAYDRGPAISEHVEDDPKRWDLEVVTEVLCEALSIPDEPASKLDPAYIEDWLLWFADQSYYVRNRCFAFLNKYGLGLLPHKTQPGDVMEILHGSPLPVVLRRASKSIAHPEGAGGGLTSTVPYRLIGECFVDGIMHGEAVTCAENEGDEFDVI